MLTSTEILTRIDEIIERAYTGFTFNIVGSDFLTQEQITQVESLGIVVGQRPLVEILYLLARQRTAPGYKKDKTLETLLNEIGVADVLPALNDEARYTVEHSKATMNQAIEDVKSTLKANVKKQILQANIDHKDDLSLETFATIPERQDKIQENTNSLLTNISYAAIGAAIVSAFNREFTTNMTNTMNSTAVDSIRNVASRDAQTPADAVVYKEVVNDDRLSPECRQLHTNPDGTPRLYTLDYIQANGSNVGKSRADWNIVIGPTHPNCRCTLRSATVEQVRKYEEAGKKLNS